MSGEKKFSIVDFLSGYTMPDGWNLKPIDLSAFTGDMLPDPLRSIDQSAIHTDRVTPPPMGISRVGAKPISLDKKPADEIETYKTAANALLLARSFFLIQRYDLATESRKVYNLDDRADYSGYSLFKDRMCSWEIVDDRVASPFEDAKFPWQDERIKALILSDANIARITLNDLPLSKSDWETLEIAAGGLDRVALDRPICRWWPGAEITELREIVLRYLETYFADTDINGPTVFAGSQVTWQDFVGEIEEWNNRHVNTRFIQRVVRSIMDGDFGSVRSASEAIVQEKGNSPKGVTFKKDTVQGGSYDAAIEALSKPASKILKQLEENGFLPNYP